MSQSNWLKLILLAAIWGGSFIFMRILAPTLGAVLTTTIRLFIAGLAMQIWFMVVKTDTQWQRWWRHYLIIGLLNAGIPFLLFSYAARHLPAGYSAIINATTPLFSALFAVIWLNDRFTPRKISGLLLGIIGVAIISYRTHHGMPHDFYLAIGACVCATLCYGLAGIYIRKFMSTAQPIAMSGCATLSSGLMLLPFALFNLPELTAVQALGWQSILFSTLGLSLLCSAVAFVIYFKLIQDVGPAQTATVTLLIPIFGLLWAWFFLHEAITPIMLIGCTLVLLSTHLILKK